MKILLIDDEQSLIDIFTQTFKTAGFEVIGAESGNEGILKAQTEHPDIIFLDQVLPDINGNQVLQMLKQDVETKDIPIAMLSNFNQDGMVRDAINLGAVDYILKYQIDPQDLIGKANQIVRTHGELADKLDQSQVNPTQPPVQPLTQAPITLTASPAQPVTPAPTATTPTQSVSASPIADQTVQTPAPTPDTVSTKPAIPSMPLAATQAEADATNQIDPALQSQIDAAVKQTPSPTTQTSDLESIINPSTPIQTQPSAQPEPTQPITPTASPAPVSTEGEKTDSDHVTEMPTIPATEVKLEESLPSLSPAATPLPTMPAVAMPTMTDGLNQTPLQQQTSVQPSTDTTVAPSSPATQLENPATPLAQNGVVTPIPQMQEEPAKQPQAGQPLPTPDTNGVMPEQPANNTES